MLACNVALRKESVDRNQKQSGKILRVCVALRKESVDRNTIADYLYTAAWVSLSARRAWIEIGSAINESRHRQSRSPQGERG